MPNAFRSFVLSAAVFTTLGIGPALAFPRADTPAITAPVMLVSGGCGPRGWRGADRRCHWPAPGRWRAADGFWYVRRVGNGCPPGYWRGPWDNCRDTPYHGPLPGGGYRP